jgi:hypothetical protein
MSPVPPVDPVCMPNSVSASAPLRWRQIILITVGAMVLYVAFRALPTGTNLHSGDFNVQGKGMVELCDPANPQFVEVTTARSPVTLTLLCDQPVVTSGREVYVTLTLATSTGKPVGPADLLVQHTRKLHLLVIDPTLQDYQHVHPEPGKTDGEWTFRFTPRLAGVYRVFADFVPVPTARSLYASTDLPVEGPTPAPVAHLQSWETKVGDYQFKLTPDAPIRAGQVANLTFQLVRKDGAALVMEPVMGAYAHLVAFDQGQRGFAHLHPIEVGLTSPPAGANPSLHFKITIPKSGVYVIWAQVKLAGAEVFAPFWFEVAP